MLSKVAELLGVNKSDTNECPDGISRHENELCLVTASLMVHVSLEHDDFSEEERASLLTNIMEHFTIKEDAAIRIMKEAIRHQKEAIDLHNFTRVITRELDQEERQEIMKLLWRVAYADDHLDHFEATILSKIAGLLGITTRDNVNLKQEARDEAAG
jgi:uncharacterized tellurite resistance protein B-like protein